MYGAHASEPTLRPVLRLRAMNYEQLAVVCWLHGDRGLPKSVYIVNYPKAADLTRLTPASFLPPTVSPRPFAFGGSCQPGAQKRDYSA